MKIILYIALVNLLLTINTNAQHNNIAGMRPDAPELARPGSFNIGVRTIHLSHKNQIDVVATVDGEKLPYYDRPLTIEVWYPANTDKDSGEYKNVLLSDAKTVVSLYGRAVRDAAALSGEQAYPLIVMSHGYPGNRYLMSHFGENLASKGYVVASIDHTDSLYQDAAAFHSTLLNRSLDQKFVLQEMQRMSDTDDHFLSGMVDTLNAGLMGYSMGGYGALISAGSGITQVNAQAKEISPNGILKQVMTGSAGLEAIVEGGFKAIVAFAPWGMEHGFWDDQALGAIRVPVFFISGSEDETSGYETGTRLIFAKSTNIDRYLLTFDNANHNAVAPIPAPDEAWEAVYNNGQYRAYTHYTDMVWDSVRANNIAQHFVTAYFGKMLKNDPGMDDYLKLVPESNAGIDETNWAGFKPRSAKGLVLEYLPKE